MSRKVKRNAAAREMTKHFEHRMRLSVENGEVTLHFVASNGDELLLDALTMSECMDDPVDAHILLQWCRDRVQELRTVDLPVDEREKVQARMDEIAKILANWPTSVEQGTRH